MGVRESLHGAILTLSIGVAAFPEDADSPSGLIQAAIGFLRCSGHLRRVCVQHYSPLIAELLI
ncbi:MAG: hypothetical protein HPY71_14960 [Firmicutes bacterium]|nr:hypothetical protein [Bacillota bacterium]